MLLLGLNRQGKTLSQIERASELVQQKQGKHYAIYGGDNSITSRAQSVAIRLSERAQAVDKARELPIETVHDLHEAGLLTLNIPLAQGGLEADLATQTAVFEIIGGACASTAWCLGNHIATGSIVQNLLGDDSRPYIEAVVEEGAILAHAQIPAGTTRAIPGGFVSSGRWPFVSFSHRARWVFLSTLVAGQPPGWAPTVAVPDPPEFHNRWFEVRIGDPGVSVEDTWHAMAVRASMSNDVLLDEVFVPQNKAPVFNRPLPEMPWVPDAPPALRAPSRATGWIAAIMLGIAQAALRDTIEYARGRSMSLGGQPRGSMPGNQFAIADAAMAIESGRAFLYQEVRNIMAKAQTMEPFKTDEVVRVQMAALVARENAQRAVDRLFSIRGAHGLYESQDFERYYRDVRIGTLHASSAPDLVRELVGKHLFGIPADVQPRWASAGGG